jgi:hypothetical protein
MANPNWRYFRDKVNSLDHLDQKLQHWGGVGWELVTILHERSEGLPNEENILQTPEIVDTWTLIFKQLDN